MAVVKSTFPITPFDFVKSNGTDSVYYTDGPSLTRQEFAEECDINTLMRRYEGHVIGGPGNLPPAVPMYFDFASIPRTLLEYMDFMQSAEASFMSLPAAVRKEFSNSAHDFVEFASAPENLPQMRTWGLAPAAEVPKEAASSSASSPPPAPPEAPKAS
ncbi:internal scaffolding protein [Blackfly microvirus SF02]|uniref:Internal scaffolding protein n=1 Tax=Blackfly microvirus SF02 TaxID=2576452 RepID=A0A4P8PTI8_9VIRU|nr:internal scaffolding protein [Blackfly microvirus SF02]